MVRSTMVSITIRKLDDEVKVLLRLRAASHGRSMEEEARSIIREAVEREKDSTDLATTLRNRFAPLGGVELEIPQRAPMPEPPRLD